MAAGVASGSTGGCDAAVRDGSDATPPLTGGHGPTRPADPTLDWRRLLEEAAAMGVGSVQFIGGEPTLHPDLPELVGHALGVGVEVSSKPGPPPPGAAVGGLGAAEGRARHLVPRGRCGATG
jgi:hypothetical protein